MSIFDNSLVEQEVFYFDDPNIHAYIMGMVKDMNFYINWWKSSQGSRFITTLKSQEWTIPVCNIIRSVYGKFSFETIRLKYGLVDLNDVTKEISVNNYLNKISEDDGLFRNHPNIYLVHDSDGQFKLHFRFDMYYNWYIKNKDRGIRVVILEIRLDKPNPARVYKTFYK